MNENKRIIAEPFLTRSRSLRKNQTPWEAKLWYYLRANRFYGLPFKRQVQIGNYIVDFSCKSKMVIVESDGSQHYEQAEYDKKKDDFLRNLGYIVLRFWNNDIDNNIQGVLEKIKQACGV